MIKKILVANRGEIALRIMRTCKRLGIKTVAIFSDVDRQSPHVLYADEAVALGDPQPTNSYLAIPKIIKACHQTGADAVHPGYGFLSENPLFAEALKKAGIILIGPSPEAMRIMGSKLAAKEAVAKYNIPMVPGTPSAITDRRAAALLAEKIGFPVLIKASAGGGGKGMRIVDKIEDFDAQMDRAVSEAESAFGDGAVFIEKYVTGPRHIEIQIMADEFGNTLYLFERECSVQRRHQKVVEEAPSAVLTPQLRRQMGEAAVLVARSCDYTGAGTVEFLLDDKHNYYFLEMNTRLQVEHPVTEMITGLDLVEMQIHVANSLPLKVRQEDLHINGHSIELRVYAEDPLNNFLPSIGRLQRYVLPSGEGVRVDDGYVQGMDIPIYYDPMISKLVVHAENRFAAIEKMKKAIAEYDIVGVSNTLSFGDYVLSHPAFVSGNFDTHFVTMHYSAKLLQDVQRERELLAAKIALAAYQKELEVVKVADAEVTQWSRV